MRERILKSVLVQMIGCAATFLAINGYQPVAVGFFIAVWCSRLIRITMLPIMAAGMIITSGFLNGVKYTLVNFAIAVILYIMEEKKSRVPIVTGALLGGSILFVMELTDYMLSGGDRNMLVMSVSTTILTISLAILFYKFIEMFQMPGSRSGGYRDKEEYREKLISYEEKINNMADSFAKMAKSVERVSIEEEIACSKADEEQRKENLNSDLHEKCQILTRQNEIYKNKLKDSRKVIITQLTEMSRIMSDFLGESYDLHSVSKNQKRELENKLKGMGISLQKVVHLKDRKGISEIIVSMKAKKGRFVSINDVIKAVNKVFDVEVETVKDKKRIVGSQMSTYRFREKPNFFVIHGMAKASSDVVSGDNFSCYSLDSGQTLLGISDGMGSGIRAYRDSEMVLELMESLMESGFSEETAIKLINTVFIMEGENAAPATVDMGIIDRYSGMCDFMKLGAASTYVKRGAWVEVLKSTSLPICGNDVPDIESTAKKLYDGDFVIMMSDGIVEKAVKEDKEEIIGRIISNIEPKKPQDMADEILSQALSELGGEKDDDMTVMVAGVWKYAS